MAKKDKGGIKGTVLTDVVVEQLEDKEGNPKVSKGGRIVYGIPTDPDTRVQLRDSNGFILSLYGPTKNPAGTKLRVVVLEVDDDDEEDD